MIDRHPSVQVTLRALRSAVLAAALGGLSNFAHAQTAPVSPTIPPNAQAVDEGLTWKGITIYGIVDIGVQNQTHGAPISDYFVGGSADVVQKNSNGSITGITPSNLSNSRVGLQGREPLFFDDWYGVFRLETYFNPQSGQIADALRSLALNNGKPLTAQTTNVDSSASGQAFIQSYAGVSHKMYGTLTFGRQNSVLADEIAKYDPNYASQAFSLIGISGVTAGGGDTQNRRLDNSAKYVGSYHLPQGPILNFEAMYRFNQSNGTSGQAYEFALGGEYAGASVDAYYSKIRDAVALGALSAAQVTALPTLCPTPLPAGGTCVSASVSNALTATVTDNETFGLTGLYNWNVVKFFGGYEHIKYMNPSTPLAPGFNVSSYTVAYVTNAAYANNERILHVYWAGVRYHVLPQLEVVGAYYGYKQQAYGSGAFANCTTALSATCSGNLDDVSLDGIYSLSKRFDAYLGSMWSEVRSGLANGYLHSTDITTSMGVRFKF